MPERIQRQRTAGWKMPEGAISVARPSRYGNPFRVICTATVAGPPWTVIKDWDRGIGAAMPFDAVFLSSSSPSFAMEQAVELYETLLTVRQRDWEPARFEKWISGARGRDLACFCPLDRPCHVDVLLRVANA